MEPNKKDESKNEFDERMLTTWFLAYLIIPAIFVFMFSKPESISYKFGLWIAVIGIPLILAGLVQLFVNLRNRKRPLISIDRQFLIYASIILILLVMLKLITK